MSARPALISHRTPPEKLSPDEVGGKGWNLFLLAHHGFPVPPWYVVSSAVFDEVVGRRRKDIGDIIQRIDFPSPASVEKAAREIGGLVLAAGWPEDLRRDLVEKTERMFGRGSLLSVRSSLVGEDSAGNSFAGQLDSFLNVPADGVPAAVARVWCSAYSARSLAYRRRKDLDLQDVSVAVVVQQMIQSRAAGVLFTRDPENAEERCVICAGFGLGEGVVSDRVKADTYVIPWKGGKASRRIEEKDAQVVLDDGIRGGNRVEPLPPARRRASVLSRCQVRRLRRLALRAEECFGVPQDMEWALGRKGRLFILQSRPIVFTGQPAGAEDIRVWDNSNIVESYPGLTLPLTFSFIRQCYEASFSKAARGFLAGGKSLEEDLPIFANMIGLLDGRVYYNLLNWYRMLSRLPGFARHRVSWDRMIGIRDKIPFPARRLTLRDRVFALAAIGYRLLTVEGNGRRFLRRFQRLYRRYRSRDVSRLAGHQLVRLYDDLKREMAGRWHLTLYNDFCAMKYYGWLKELCDRWTPGTDANLHDRLLCGEHGMESIAPLRSLARMAESIRSRPSWRAILGEGTEREAWENIQREPACRELKSALHGHLEIFGDRGFEDLKLESAVFREDPPALIALLRRHVRSGSSAAEMEDREKRIRREAEKAVRRHLRDPFKRLLLAFVVRNARRAIANRENMRFARTRLYGIIRRLFNRMGGLLAEQGLIASASDIHYLAVEEIFGTVQGAAVTRDLKALVRIRKLDYARFREISPRERFSTRGIPCLGSDAGEIGPAHADGTLTGIGCSSGTAEAPAVVQPDPRGVFPPGDHILVARSTDPAWVFLMASSRGIVVERGSVLSHSAIIGRELGIPTVVGAANATRFIPDGSRVRMDGSTGEVRWG